MDRFSGTTVGEIWINTPLITWFTCISLIRGTLMMLQISEYELQFTYYTPQVLTYTSILSSVMVTQINSWRPFGKSLETSLWVLLSWCHRILFLVLQLFFIWW